MTEVTATTIAPPPPCTQPAARTAHAVVAISATQVTAVISNL